MASARYSISLLQVGQSQKELTHNEGLQALENCVQPIVEGAPSNVPPSAPEVGQQFLVAEDPTAEFLGAKFNLATWTEAGWLFTAPRERFSAVDAWTGLSWSFESGAWRSGVVRGSEVQVEGKRVVGSQRSGIRSPSGGTVVDQEARVALEAVLLAMREHGLIAS